MNIFSEIFSRRKFMIFIWIIMSSIIIMSIINEFDSVRYIIFGAGYSLITEQLISGERRS